MANNNISEKARLARNAYIREWRKKNPEKVLAAQERYWEKKVAAAQSEAEREKNNG